MKRPRTILCIAAAAALAGLFVLAGCQLGDASIRVEWTINGESAGSDTCDAAGGAWVRIIEDENDDGAHDAGEWYSARRACRDGRFETLKHFFSGHTHYVAYELLDIYDAVVSRVPETGFRAFVPAAGVNQVDVDFPTGPVCGNDACDAGETPLSCPADCAASGASVSFAWYIHGVRGGQGVTIGAGQSEDEVCTVIQGVGGFAGPLGVQLWVDEDGDGTADQLFDFACPAGQGLTTAEWTAGAALGFAFALLDAAGAGISQSPVWASQVLVAGENNLGTVDFFVGDYGPLDVTLTWADQVATPAFVTCEALDQAQVSAMGYLLCSGGLSGGICPAGMVIDEVNIDADPATCRNDLAWDILDFGTYTLVLDGEDTLGTTLWGSECQGLSVTSSERDENQFDCTVLMTATP